MFGQKDKSDNDQAAITPVDLAVPATDVPLPEVQPTDESWQHPGVPMVGPSGMVAPEATTLEPPVTQAFDPVAAAAEPAPVYDPSLALAPEPMPSAPLVAVTPDEPAVAPVADPVNDDLLSIKQQALTQLSPLIGQLDQTPEEKFRTTMMMIQASDDKTMVQAAYQAAQAIADEKTRAQALLDVINEINYFTTPH